MGSLHKDRPSDFYPRLGRVEEKEIAICLGDLGTPTADYKYPLFQAAHDLELVEAYLLSDNSMGTHSANHVDFDLRNETDNSVIASRNQTSATEKETSTFVKLGFVSTGTVAGTEVDKDDVLTLNVDDNGTAQDIGILTVVVRYIELLDDVMNP